MDELMRQVLEPVLHDLESAAVSPPLVEPAEGTGDPGWPLVLLRSPTGNQMNLQVPRLGPLCERIMSVADQAQVFVFEELWGRSPADWPPCPRHPRAHSLRAKAQDDTAMWVCPVDDSVVAVIGTL